MPNDAEAAENEGGSDIRVVLGLGNPGEKYVDTRHNVGFRVLDEMARRRGTDLDTDRCRSKVAEVEIPDGGVALLAAPQTFMNRSGYAARCLTELHGIAPEQVLVVYDEVHLPLGTLRLRPKGSPGGHRGMESVLESLGTGGVPRLRVGVGGEDGPPAGEDLVSFVLDRFATAEMPSVERLVRRAADACEAWLVGGAEPAMQKFNGPLPDAE